MNDADPDLKPVPVLVALIELYPVSFPERRSLLSLAFVQPLQCPPTGVKTALYRDPPILPMTHSGVLVRCALRTTDVRTGKYLKWKK